MNADHQTRIDEAAEYYDTHDAAEEIAGADLTAHDPQETSPMVGYSVRLPKAVLQEARKLAKERGLSTGAWLRDAIEQAVSGRNRTDAVPVAALLHLIEQHVDQEPAKQESPADHLPLVARYFPGLAGLPGFGPSHLPISLSGLLDAAHQTWGDPAGAFIVRARHHLPGASPIGHWEKNPFGHWEKTLTFSNGDETRLSPEVPEDWQQPASDGRANVDRSDSRARSTDSSSRTRRSPRISASKVGGIRVAGKAATARNSTSRKGSSA